MPWHRFVLTKAFWLTADGKPDSLGYFYMSTVAAGACWVLAFFAAFFGLENYLLVTGWCFAMLAAINWMFADG